jgi:hypothetical protein
VVAVVVEPVVLDSLEVVAVAVVFNPVLLVVLAHPVKGLLVELDQTQHMSMAAVAGEQAQQVETLLVDQLLPVSAGMGYQIP